MALSLLRYSVRFLRTDEGQKYMLKQSSKKHEFRPMIVASLATKNEDDGVFPEDLVMLILSWLPVEDLLRCKSVCKSWYSLISGSDFISIHLENYYKNDNSCYSCLLALYPVLPNELVLFELNVDETPKVIATEELDYVPMYGSCVCGPCDGIYYLFDYSREKHALWNPAINQLKYLPPVITKPNLPSNIGTCNEAYGFGFDPFTRDYKVVVIMRYYCKNDDDIEITEPSSVFVYSLQTDCWSYCGDLSLMHWYEREQNLCYTFLNGSFYWWLSDGYHAESYEFVVSFDMATNAFHEIQGPNYEKPASRNLALYQESVALLTLHEINKSFVIWKLNDGLWTKIYTMEPLSDIRSAVGHWKDDKIFFVSDAGRLVLFDPLSQEISDFGFYAGLWFKGIYVYRESLVSVEDNSCSPFQCHDEAGRENQEP